ncbi:MAG: hypothetical protein R3A79_22295 [Nannocystaceae bacterium]
MTFASSALAAALALASTTPAARADAHAHADEPADTQRVEVPPQLVLLDRSQRRIQTFGMATLTAWSIANIVGGVAGNLATPRGDPLRYAHQMNAMWNTVNLTLGAIGLANARRERGVIGRRLGVAAEVAKTQRVFAVNALLDVLYILGGYATWEVGRARESPRLVGYGGAVILQGAFLMAFDLGMIAAHERNLRRRLPGYAIAPAPTPGGAALVLRGAF